MTFGQSVKTCLAQKYFFKFQGRASRSEFWWFMLFIALINGASTLILNQLPARVAASIGLIISLLLLPPNLGAAVRRLHDRNMRGWWLLLPIGAVFFWLLSGGPAAPQNPLTSLVSLSMSLAYLIILCLPGKNGPNRFGPDPLVDNNMRI